MLGWRCCGGVEAIVVELMKVIGCSSLKGGGGELGTLKT